MEGAVASTATTAAAAAAAPAAMHKKCEPVNVHVKEDGFCKLHYNVKGIASASAVSWDIVEREGKFYAVFQATVNGKDYYNESLPIPADVNSLIAVKTKGAKKDYYKVKITKKGQIKIGSYFAQKM